MTALIGATVEPQLTDVLEKLLLGEYELHELCSPLAGFYVAGFENGRQCAMRPELERLNYEADLWFWCYANKRSPADFYRHATDVAWAEAVR